MDPKQHSSAQLAARMTRAASLQTYYTIRCLVDRGMVNDAYRAYAYFRWVDDWLDNSDRPRAERLAFVKRQETLVDRLYRGDLPRMDGLSPEEWLLVELVGSDTQENSGLQAYIRNMMAIMSFDAKRRGRLISQNELDEYTRWLAVAVTEALHHFIGHDCPAPGGDIRYLAVTGAHITHMLRDTLEDVEAGYYNVPSGYLALSDISPQAVDSPAYQEWVKMSVRLARHCFLAGREHLSRVQNFRCRFAGYAYVFRFEVVLNRIEREQYRLRRQYPERKGLRAMLLMVIWAFWKALVIHRSPVLINDPAKVK